MAVISVSVGSSLSISSSLPVGRRRGTFIDANGMRLRIPVLEAWESRSVQETENGLELTRRFYVFGTKDPIDGISQGPQRGDVLAEDGRFRVVSRRIEPHSRGGGRNDVLLITVTYQAGTAEDDVVDDPDKPGGGSGGGGDAVKSQVSVSIGAESVHLEKAISQESFGGRDFGDLIGQTERGVEGVDISAPILTFTETHTFSSEAFTSAYLNTLEQLAFTVNNATFRGFAPGTVRFDGVTSEPAGGNWRLTFAFSARREEVVPVEIFNTEGASQVFNIHKGGWEYIWVKTERSITTDLLDNEIEVQRIVGAAVAKVYEESDFSRLGIGVQPFTAPANVRDSQSIDQAPGFDL